jgi:2-octaprenylphenol hydroxylase
MQQEGVVLLGDAAHGYHPMAGQGLNVGLLDSAVLVDQLVQNAERLGDFAHQTGLRRYERQRRLQQRALFDLTTNLHRLYGRSEWWLRLGRNFGMRLFDELTPLKKVLAKRANGHLTDLPVRFRSNPEAMPF